jgi:hypothetical protein
MRLSGLTCHGGIDLFAARIKGQLWLAAAHLDRGTSGAALNAPQLIVGGGVYCHNGFTANGAINLYGATIGLNLELPAATLAAPAGIALRGEKLTVSGDVVLNSGFTTTDTVDLARCAIGGALDIDQAQLSGASVDLAGGTIGTLRGQPDGRPQRWRLDNLTYTSLEPYLPVAQRLRWLAENDRPYHPQPYEQLARYYRAIGHDEQARTVLLAKQRHRRKALSLPMQAWGLLQDAVMGCGYRPTRALLWLAGLTTAISAYFSASPPRPVDSTNAPAFHPVIYALDILVPILNLGQKNAYIPTGPGQWIAWTAEVSGWILATTIVAAATRVLSRN